MNSDDKKNKYAAITTIAFLVINLIFLWGTWEIGNTLNRVEQHLVSINQMLREYGRKP